MTRHEDTRQTDAPLVEGPSGLCSEILSQSKASLLHSPWRPVSPRISLLLTHTQPPSVVKAKHPHREKFKQREKDQGKNVRGGRASGGKRSFKQSKRKRGSWEMAAGVLRVRRSAGCPGDLSYFDLISSCFPLTLT